MEGLQHQEGRRRAWFIPVLLDLPPVYPISVDRFVLNGRDELALVVSRNRVIGYCHVREVWPSGIVSYDGLAALKRLGIQ